MPPSTPDPGARPMAAQSLSRQSLSQRTQTIPLSNMCTPTRQKPVRDGEASSSSESTQGQHFSQVSNARGPSSLAEATVLQQELEISLPVQSQSFLPKIDTNAYLSRWAAVATILSLIGMMVFGGGAWVGMSYANFYTKKAYGLDLWEKCQAYHVSLLTKQTRQLDPASIQLIRYVRTFKRSPRAKTFLRMILSLQ